MARKKLTAGNSIVNATNYQTAIVQPGPNTLVLMFVANTRPTFPGGTPTTPTISGTGLTWHQVQTVTTPNGNDARLTCFRSMAPAPTAGQIGIDFGGETQDLCAWSLFEYDNVDASASGGAAAVAQSGLATGSAAALSTSLMPSADPMRNLSVGAIMLDLFNAPVRPVDPGAGFTEIDEQTPNHLFGKGATLQTQDSATALSTISWTWNGAANAAAIVLEIKAAALPAPPPGPGPVVPQDPDEPLIRRFEPVLFFHPQEPCFPVDAKRWVEHAALWASRSAFDDKNNWGGMSGDPFPRQPMVPAGNLAAAAGEAGDYLGKPEFLLADERDERFLELGGWKDKSGTHEAGVTASSANVYADRDEIGNRYQNEPALRDSRFWYHAELYDTDRLNRLSAQVSAPDLTKILARFRNPLLLCYYLFFPAHVQTVDLCQNIEAKEAGCHAGDWQCVAILFDTPGSGNTTQVTPRFFGYTGSRPVQVPINGTLTYRPYQFDDEGLTVMKVEAWRPASGDTANQPEVVGEHPRLYVARGSHSLYMTPGKHEVFPFPDGKDSQGCALYDTPSVAPSDLSDPPEDDFGADAGAFLAKMAGLGALAGLIAAGLEGLLPGGGFEGVGTRDAPTPDEGPPAAGAGKTVRPAGLAIPDGGTDVQDWTSEQGLELDGRRYYFLVDRVNQIWWPSDDNGSGFRGRWGQHVTSDFLPRRSGPKFPPYWKMFLLALADGDASKLLDLNA